MRATITDCSVKELRRRRAQGQLFWQIRCAAKFSLNGKTETGGFESLSAYYQHRPQWWANPGVDELRAWTAQHPSGSTVVVRSDPDWPPTLELDPTPEIFDYWSNRLTGRLAGIAAVIGAALIALVLGVPR